MSQISQPSHYIEGRRYEPRDVIRDWDLNFNLGNVVKYASRAGRKGDILEDLKKAKQYLEFEIEAIRSVTTGSTVSGAKMIYCSGYGEWDGGVKFTYSIPVSSSTSSTFDTGKHCEYPWNRNKETHNQLLAGIQSEEERLP